ncbi:MAG: 4Fe-4S dicluster domain-containing protein [Planctomycetota bacterium]
MNRRNFIKNALATGVTAVGMTELGTSLFGHSNQPVHSSRILPLRPPGALGEKEFLTRCIRCMRCADACPNNAIVPIEDHNVSGRKWTPAIKARRQACMLCNGVEGETLKCTAACPSGALQLIHKDADEIQQKVNMGVAQLDEALCYSYNNWSCGACYRACPFPGRAMTIGLWERPEIVADACIGCGACERACIRYPQAVRVKPQGETA